MKLGDFISEHSRLLVDAQDPAAFVAEHPHPFLVVEHLGAESGADGARSLQTKATPANTLWSSGKFDVFPVTRKDKREGFMVAIGRAANCDVCLDSPAVSKLHAYFRRDVSGSADLTITDPGSSNGTHVNGVALAKGVAKPVKDGDTILIAGIFRALFQSSSTFFRFARTMKKFV